MKHATDYSLSINRSLPVKRLNFSIGTGIAYVYHLIDLYTLQLGSYIPDEYRFVKKGRLGVPADFGFMYRKRKGFTVGLGFHANFNAINSFYNGYLQFGYVFK